MERMVAMMLLFITAGTMTKLVVDSGATVQCVWDATRTAHLIEQNSSGGVDLRAVCIAIGHLCGVTFCKSKSNNWSNVLITPGYSDAWVIRTSARMFFSQLRAKIQGHRYILEVEFRPHQRRYWRFYTVRARGANTILHLSLVPVVISGPFIKIFPCNHIINIKKIIFFFRRSKRQRKF